MDNSVREKEKIKRKKTIAVIGLTFLAVLGVALNYFGGVIAKKTGLPFYFDTVGTVLSAAVGGFFPALSVGALTNVIKGIYDPTSAYFGFINVLIAIIVSILIKKGWMKKFYKVLIMGVILALVAGILGTFPSYFLYGFGGEGLAAEMAVKIYNATGFPQFLSQLLANCSVEFIDKPVTVLIVFFLQMGVPESIKENTILDAWKQTPLSAETLKKIRSIDSKTVSLRTKILLILFISPLCIAIAATGISYYLYRENTLEEHKYLAISATNLAASMIDPEKVDSYLVNGRSVPGYGDVEKRLYEIRNSSADIEFLYVYRVALDGCHVVFDLDTEDVPAEKPGAIVPIDESFKPVVGDLITGKEIDPIISNDTFGYLLTVYKPIYDSEGKCVCYAAADVSMTKLQHNTYMFFTKLISMFLGFFLLILTVGMYLAEFGILIPLNTMTYTATVLSRDDITLSDAGLEVKDLDIRTGDEIEELYRVLYKSSQSSQRQFEDMQRHIEGIDRSRKDLASSLAELIESRDHYTKGHVKRITRYTEIILRSMKELEYYKDTITEGFIENVTAAAPLHDIGKINVSEKILNKPGKLTEDEFNTVKQHAADGGDVFAGLLKRSPESMMFTQAENIARYHHEKWDGSGYPEGRKGEDIPLSARVVAAADVLDAMLSKKSYKEPFSFEDAMDVINDESGSAFDPLVAEAIVMAEEEIRKV